MQTICQNENLAGLKARTKLLLQIVAALIVASYLCIYAGFNTDLYVPFIKNPVIDMAHHFLQLDLRDPAECQRAVEGIEENERSRKSGEECSFL